MNIIIKIGLFLFLFISSYGNIFIKEEIENKILYEFENTDNLKETKEYIQEITDYDILNFFMSDLLNNNFKEEDFLKFSKTEENLDELDQKNLFIQKKIMDDFSSEIETKYKKQVFNEKDLKKNFYF